MEFPRHKNNKVIYTIMMFMTD